MSFLVLQTSHLGRDLAVLLLLCSECIVAVIVFFALSRGAFATCTKSFKSLIYNYDVV